MAKFLSGSIKKTTVDVSLSLSLDKSLEMIKIMTDQSFINDQEDT